MSCSWGRGCHGVRLETFDAQARPFSFYEKRGYVRFGEQPDCRTAGLPDCRTAGLPDCLTA